VVPGYNRIMTGAAQIGNLIGRDPAILNLAQVHAVIAPYCANPQEVEADLSEEEALANGSNRKTGCQ